MNAIMNNKYILKRFKAFLKMYDFYEIYIKLLYKSHHSSRLSCILFLKETIEEQPNRLIIDAFPWIESRQINVSPHKWSLLHKKWEKNIKDSLKDNAF